MSEYENSDIEYESNNSFFSESDEEFDEPNEGFANEPNEFEDTASFDDVEPYYEEADSQLSKKELKKLEKEQKKQNKELQKSTKNDTKKYSKHSTVSDSLIKKDMKLYVLSDDYKAGLVSYFRELGLNVTNVLSDIEDVKTLQFFVDGEYRVAVIETGTGKFMNSENRKRVIETLGMVDDDTHFTVFYTDDMLRVETSDEIGKLSKKIEWIKYENTIGVLATLLNEPENYVIGESSSDEYKWEPNEEDIHITGKKVAFIDSKPDRYVSVKPEWIRENVINEDASSNSLVRAFEPHI